VQKILSHCVTSHPGQLILAIHPWVGAVSMLWLWPVLGSFM